MGMPEVPPDWSRLRSGPAPLPPGPAAPSASWKALQQGLQPAASSRGTAEAKQRGAGLGDDKAGPAPSNELHFDQPGEYYSGSRPLCRASPGLLPRLPTARSTKYC